MLAMVVDWGWAIGRRWAYQSDDLQEAQRREEDCEQHLGRFGRRGSRVSELSVLSTYSSELRD